MYVYTRACVGSIANYKHYICRYTGIEEGDRVKGANLGKSEHS